MFAPVVRPRTLPRLWMIAPAARNATPAVTASMMRIGSAVVLALLLVTVWCSSIVINVNKAAASEVRICVRRPAGLLRSSRSKPTTAPTITAASIRTNASHGAMCIEEPVIQSRIRMRPIPVAVPTQRCGRLEGSRWRARQLAVTLGTRRRNLHMDHRRIAPTVFTLLACALLASAGARGAAAPDPFAKVRETFRKAYEQVDDPAAKPHPDGEALRAYPLYPYLQAARIRRALADAGEEF